MKPTTYIFIAFVLFCLSVYFGYKPEPMLGADVCTGTTYDGQGTDDLYDTVSGDLEVGQYAKYWDGRYRIHYPASTGTYTDATSTVNWSNPARIVYENKAPKDMTEVKIIGSKSFTYFNKDGSKYIQDGLTSSCDPLKPLKTK